MFVPIYSFSDAFLSRTLTFSNTLQLWRSCRGHGERSISVEKALHGRSVYISCLWEQLKTSLVVFGGLPWGLCRSKNMETAPTRDLASIIDFLLNLSLQRPGSWLPVTWRKGPPAASVLLPVFLIFIQMTFFFYFLHYFSQGT